MLQATHTGTAAATGRLLIYLGLLSLGGRGLLEINAAFSPLMCGNAAHSDALLVTIPFMLACFVQSLLLNR